MLLIYSGSLLMEIGKIFSQDCSRVQVLKVGQKVSLISDANFFFFLGNANKRPKSIWLECGKILNCHPMTWDQVCNSQSGHLVMLSYVRNKSLSGTRRFLINSWFLFEIFGFGWSAVAPVFSKRWLLAHKRHFIQQSKAKKEVWPIFTLY